MTTKSHKILKFERNALAVHLKCIYFIHRDFSYMWAVFGDSRFPLSQHSASVVAFLLQSPQGEVCRKLYFQFHTTCFHSGKYTVIWLPSASAGKLQSLQIGPYPLCPFLVIIPIMVVNYLLINCSPRYLLHIHFYSHCQLDAFTQ